MTLYTFLGFEVIALEWNSIVVTKASTDTLIMANCIASKTELFFCFANNTVL